MNNNRNQGLTTTKAPFIENARENNELFIHQPYKLYSEDNHSAWSQLFHKLRPLWSKYGNSKFLEGVEQLKLSPDKIPKIEEINAKLAPLTGFKLQAVSGFVPVIPFFDCLNHRKFPTTITIRDSSRLDYLPEPDIFHDIAGHVPMHTDPIFADTLVKFGSLARLAIARHIQLKDKEEWVQKISSNIRALSRFFWFTIEFGLMKRGNETCAFGSGLLSSADEIEYSIESSLVQRIPFQLEWVINQTYEIDRFQSILFVVDSFDHLFSEVQSLERWLLEGKLDNVSPGNPFISDEDINELENISSIMREEK